MATIKYDPDFQKNPQGPMESIAIIGCGNMGSAIGERLSPYAHLFFYDRHLSKTRELEGKGFGKAATNLAEAFANANLVILAIKPQSLFESASAISEALTSGHTLVSILTGVSIQKLKKLFSKGHFVRMMPNVALLCGEGMIALTCDEPDREHLEQKVSSQFKPLGKLLWLQESKFDAFAALAGSGPAFIFALTEAIIDSGVAMGFSVKQAQTIAYQMLRGSVELMDSTAKHPGELKWLVTSPGGTTIAGLIAFEEHAVRSGIIKTFLATYQKTLQH